MTTLDRPAVRPTRTDDGRRATRVFAILAGLSSAFILLQGLWAGLFMSTPDKDPQSTPWLEVHAWGGKAAILFALLTTVWAVRSLRHRRDLVIGAAALTALLVLESYIGGLIVDAGQDVMAAVHVPLALALTALAVWLPLRARSAHRATR